MKSYLGDLGSEHTILGLLTGVKKSSIAVKTCAVVFVLSQRESTILCIKHLHAQAFFMFLIVLSN